ncbi:hypothetical protein FQ330_03085 [Agrococcus sediminis]|uniref:Uncharacterized protein n=1 Tax=Agrococcus sediminis TaxID=2599924 RepID=A0A5M8QPC8_9MICO|nr:hypothetical protein [Agrococcus sediminis]KAA6436403.1 hypothetical protein FQ330_03085 [Agrococcus sediminis]
MSKKKSKRPVKRQFARAVPMAIQLPGLIVKRTESGMVSPVGPERAAHLPSHVLINLDGHDFVLDNATILDELCPLPEAEKIAAFYEAQFGQEISATALRHACISLVIGDVEAVSFRVGEAPLLTSLSTPVGIYIHDYTDGDPRVEALVRRLNEEFGAQQMRARLEDSRSVASLVAAGAEFVPMSERGEAHLPEMFARLGKAAA